MSQPAAIRMTYYEHWGQHLAWWEHAALLFQKTTLHKDGNYLLAAKIWRGKIYVLADGYLPTNAYKESAT